MEIKADRHIWGARYEGDNVKMRWYYQDVPSNCLCEILEVRKII